MNPTCESSSELKTYLVPRNGMMVSVQAGDLHALRLARTELELLKRLRRCVERVGSTAGLPIKARYSPGDRRELVKILIDAQDPTVDEMIAQIDEDFGDLRKEILMTVVNEQAENIAQEAAESGAIQQAKRDARAKKHAPANQTGSPDQNQPLHQDQPSHPPVIEGGEAELEQALAAAEAELAKVVGADPSTDSSAKAQTPDTIVEEPPPTTVEVAPEDCPKDKSAESDEPAGNPDEPKTECDDQEKPADTPQVEASAESADSDDAPEAPQDEPKEPARDPPEAEPVNEEAESSSDPQFDAPTGEYQPAETAADAPDSTDSYSPQRAERAVVEIEKGIRKLASILSDEVNDHWKRAQEAFDETIENRKRTQKAHRDATELLREISHLKEEAQIARDDANVARREAKMIREDAKVAKERADASAAAAEASADKATREAENAMRRGRSKS